MRRGGDTCGQATSEYVALVALVAVVLALAAGLTAGGLGGELLAGMQRALCRVTGTVCARPQTATDALVPCPVERTTSGESLEGAFELVRVGGGGTLTAERGSDGRVTVTLASGTSAGAAVAIGGELALGGARGGTAGAQVLKGNVSSRSWTLPSAAAAQAFVARYGSKATFGGKVVDAVRSGCSILCDAIGWTPHAELPPPDERYLGAGATVRLSAAHGPAGLGASHGSLLGVRLGRDGDSTWYAQLDAETDAELGLGAATLGAGSGRETVVALTLDARRRPVRLALRRVGAVGADVAADGERGSVSAQVGTGRARVAEVDATLDLLDPDNRAAAAAFMTALREPASFGRLRRSAAALGRRIASAGVVDRRSYALSESASALGATLALGAQLGGSFARTRERMRLLSAETRLPGLPFLPRDDCRAAAPAA